MAPSPKPSPKTVSRLERQIEETTKELADERLLAHATRIRLFRLDDKLTSQRSSYIVDKNEDKNQEEEEERKWLDILRGQLREEREKRNYEACLFTVKHVLVTYLCDDGNGDGDGYREEGGEGLIVDFEGEGLAEDYRREGLRKALEDGELIGSFLDPGHDFQRKRNFPSLRTPTCSFCTSNKPQAKLT